MAAEILPAPAKSRVARELAAIVLIALAAFGVLSLVSAAASQNPNLCGILGSAVAAGAGGLLGVQAYVSAILVLGAAAFHQHGMTNVADIGQAYQLLTPVLGVSFASVLFAAALLCSGQNSTLTGTLAGQIVMEGFLHWRLKPWLRRLITRSLAIIPAAIVIGVMGEGHVTALLILSQVVLSFQLPFAVVPLIQFTGDRSKMGEFVNGRLTSIFGWGMAAAIIVLNAALLWLTFGGKL